MNCWKAYHGAVVLKDGDHQNYLRNLKKKYSYQVLIPEIRGFGPEPGHMLCLETSTGGSDVQEV